MKTLTTLLAMLLASPAIAAEVDYLRDVKPLLRNKCYACHGALKQEGGLRLDTAAKSRQGGDSGAAVVPNELARSLLLERIISADESIRMPQETGPLSAQEVGILKAWIEQGAPAPAGEQPESDPRQHWAFRPLVLPTIPPVHNTTWVRNPVDAFIAAEHERRGLTPNPPANASQLLRRVYIDLIGVPPTRDQLRAFLADTSEQAYLRAVDQLLASPHYGERWGRHWMDVWRYSDWYGRRGVPDVLNSYGQIWRWRDWIVRSLNEDKGYDRMVMEMLAADEITPADDDNIVATGFVVRNFYRWNYNTWMKDQIEHTGKAFLGLTLNCCHCHDHKYDPITNEEYFRFRAFFEPIEIRQDRVPGEPDPGPYPKYEYAKSYKPITSGMVRIMDEKLAAETFVYTGGESRNVVPGKPAVTPGGPAILGGDELVIERVNLPPEVWYPGLRPFVQHEEIAKRETELTNVQSTLEKARQSLAAAESKADRELAQLMLVVEQANLRRAEAELQAIRARIHADRVRYQGESGDVAVVSNQASKAERRAALETAHVQLAQAERALVVARRQSDTDEKARAELQKATQQRDAAMSMVETAQQELEKESAEYTPLSPQYPKQSSGRRTALARWITSRTNPLPPRVAVNHIWLRHFGQALVESTENLGLNGARPTHPELLDWLAFQLTQPSLEPAAQPEPAGVWQMKRIHRLIVTSNAYRMRSGTSGLDHPNYQLDRDNRYLWRFKTARMEAEAIRDSILHASGQLDYTIGGKEIDQEKGMTVPRRSIYFEHHGEGRMQILDLFDAANPIDCYRRSTSVRPQQALVMANSALALRQGRLLARKLERELGEGEMGKSEDKELGRKGDEVFITAAFEQLLTRKPTTAELETSISFLRRQVELFGRLGAEKLAAEESTGESENRPLAASTNLVTRARENLVQALFSHSDFVTVR